MCNLRTYTLLSALHKFFRTIIFNLVCQAEGQASTHQSAHSQNHSKNWNRAHRKYAVQCRGPIPFRRAFPDYLNVGSTRGVTCLHKISALRCHIHLALCSKLLSWLWHTEAGLKKRFFFLPTARQVEWTCGFLPELGWVTPYLVVAPCRRRVLRLVVLFTRLISAQFANPSRTRDSGEKGRLWKMTVITRRACWWWTNEVTSSEPAELRNARWNYLTSIKSCGRRQSGSGRRPVENPIIWS